MSYYAYIATNSGKNVLYTGVTNDLSRRIFEHKEHLNKGFTSKYKVNRLVWYESFPSPYEAISAEKRIKGWTRSKKLDLIKTNNPQLSDLLANAEDSS